MNFTQKMSLAVGAAALMGAGYSAEVANAATDQMTITAEVVNDCTLTAEDLAFGSYVAANGEKEGETSIGFDCAPGLTITIGIGPSASPPASGRQMQEQGGGFQVLTYDLYQDLEHQQRWGTVAEALTLGPTAGGPESVPVYGLINGGQSVGDGLYSDTLTVTLTIDG